MRKRFFALLMAGLMTLSLAACGGSGNSTSTSTSTSTSAQTSTSVSASSSVEETPVEATKVIVGIGNILNPQFYINEDGELVGYDVEVLKAIDEALPQYEFVFEQYDFSALMVALETGKIAIADFQLGYTEARAETYLYPTNYYDISHTVMITKADVAGSLSSFADMGGMSVAQMPTSNFYRYVNEYNEGAEADKKIALQAIDSLPVADALQMVNEGRIGGTICLKSTYTELQKALGLNIDVAFEVISNPSYFMFPKAEAELCTAVDGALTALFESGKMSELALKWYGEDVFAK